MAEAREPRLQARQGSSEQEITPAPHDHGAIEMGTVGWQDGDPHVDNGTGSNGGVTLVRVTLYRGRDPLSDHTPDRAQGTRVLARCSAGHIPADGTQVLVARPAGFDGPGLWHIISNPGAGAGPILPADGGTFIRQGLDGTLSLGTTTDGTKDGTLVQFQVRRDGFLLLGPWGKISFDQGGFHLLHHSGARIDLGGVGGLPSPLDTLASYVTFSGALAKIQASALALGPDAGVSDAVAHSTSIVAALAAIETWAVLVDAALIAIGSGLSALGYFAAGTAVTAETAGLGAMSATITAESALIPSQSTAAV